MKKLILILFLSTICLHAQTDLSKEKQEADLLIKKFGKVLKTKLIKAMQDGGPINAIGVCNVQAPIIAITISDSSKWEVSRISVKNRNPENKPDEYELKILKEFDKLLANDADIEDLYSIEETKEEIRYLKAIGTGGICLKCHGTNMPEELTNKLNELYPEDLATGFKKGDIRGAFSLVRKK